MRAISFPNTALRRLTGKQGLTLGPLKPCNILAGKKKTWSACLYFSSLEVSERVFPSHLREHLREGHMKNTVALCAVQDVFLENRKEKLSEP